MTSLVYGDPIKGAQGGDKTDGNTDQQQLREESIKENLKENRN